MCVFLKKQFQLGSDCFNIEVNRLLAAADQFCLDISQVDHVELSMLEGKSFVHIGIQIFTSNRAAFPH